LKSHEADEHGRLAERCLEYYRTTCMSAAAGARYCLPEWLLWAEVEIDNIRAVLQDCVARQDSARGLDIVASMRYYWITHGTTESLGWLDQFAGSGEASPQPQVGSVYQRRRLGRSPDQPLRTTPEAAPAHACSPLC